MIYEGSCDCSDDAENSVLHHRNKKRFKSYIKKVILNFNKISQ